MFGTTAIPCFDYDGARGDARLVFIIVCNVGNSHRARLKSSCDSYLSLNFWDCFVPDSIFLITSASCGWFHRHFSRSDKRHCFLLHLVWHLCSWGSPPIAPHWATRATATTIMSSVRLRTLITIAASSCFGYFLTSACTSLLILVVAFTIFKIWIIANLPVILIWNNPRLQVVCDWKQRHPKRQFI